MSRHPNHPLGSHDMFIAEVVNVKADEQYIHPHTGTFELDKSNLLAYSHGQYYTLGSKIGRFGHSVEKEKEKKEIIEPGHALATRNISDQVLN